MAASNPWQARAWQARVGQRVVVRYRLDDGAQNDALGELERVDQALHVASRSGPVVIPLDRVVTGKVVPPPPSRSGPPHLVIRITDLQSVMAWHWRAIETEPLGGWMLRASAGFTGRANSVLPLGAPGTDLTEALARTVGWYAARGLPATVSLAGPADGGVPDDDGPANTARAAVTAAGWQVVPDSSALVLTARTSSMRTRLRSTAPAGPAGLPDGLRLVVDDEPDAAWLARYRYRGQELPPAAAALLRSAPEQVFVSVRDGADAVAVARGSLGAGWAGLTAVEVVPGRRRQGLGTAVLRAVVEWAATRDASCIHLQVAESNPVAQNLYRSLGFAVHHRYDYLRAPSG